MTHGVRPNLGYGDGLSYAALFVFAITFSLLAAQATSASSLSETYNAEGDYKEGAIVSLSSVSPPTVTLADLNNNEYLVGVVENPENSLLSLNARDRDLNVALEGDVFVYVSDIGGPIEAGDFVGTSWIAGVGMYSNNAEDQRLLGIALENFDPNARDVRTVSDVQTPAGTVTANIGAIAVRLFARDVGPNAASLQGPLQSLTNRIAGKDVSFSRSVLAVGLFTVAALLSGLFLSNAIRGSFISLGRNPLAGRSIFISLMQVSGVSIALLLVGAVLAYAVLVI